MYHAKTENHPGVEAEMAAKERQIAQLQHRQQLENRSSYYEKGDCRKGRIGSLPAARLSKAWSR